MFLYGGSKPPPYAQSPSIANIQSEKYILHSVGARAKFTMPRLGDADRVRFANRSIPALR